MKQRLLDAWKGHWPAALVVLLVALGGTVYFFELDEQLPPGVTKAGIRSLRVGMSEQDVIELLGPPRVRNQVVQHGQEVVFLFYAGPHAGGAPGETPRRSLAVVLTDGKLSSAGAKRTVPFFNDDEGVYSLSIDRQPAWESPDFEGAFPR